MSHLPGRMNRPFVVAALFLLFLTLRLPRFAAVGLTNAGYARWLPAAVEQVERNERFRPDAALGEAGVLWQEALRWDEDFQPAVRGLGWVNAAQGLDEAAVANWQAGGLTEQHLIDCGESSRQQKAFDLARRCYQLALLMAPDTADPWFYQGMLDIDAAEWQAAVASLEAFVTHTDKDQRLAVAYYHLGFIHYRYLDDASQALAYFDQARPLEQDLLASGRQRHWLHYYRGELLEQSGQIRAARQSYETVLQLPGTTPYLEYLANARLGWLVWQSEQDYLLAEQLLLAAVAAPLPDEDDKGWAYWRLADVYLAAGDFYKAAAIYRGILARHPDDTKAQRALEALP